MNNTARAYAPRQPRPRNASNDNQPQRSEWQKMQPLQEAKIVSKATVLRENITADSLKEVAEAQGRGSRGRAQAKALRDLAYAMEKERGW